MRIIIKIHKKIALALLAIMIAAFCVPTVTSFASDGQLWDDYVMPSTRQKERLLDNAELLTASEKQEILGLLNSISSTHQANVAILTVNSHRGSIQDYADDYFDYNGFQADYDGSGILFMLSMEDREWAISTHGTAAYVFTDYGQEELMDEMIPYLRDDDYYDAFKAFIDVSERYFTLYEEGTPYDVDYKDTSPAAVTRALLICILIGLVIGFIPIGIMSLDLKSVKASVNAAGYQIHNGLHMGLHTDTYIRSSTSRTKIPENNSNSGGGSSFHVSSSGSSHGGSSGHF
ncbi:hypothetical protein bpr_I0210 [Butyrivibrio proteoclasticus B316]|uniref:TPM domain-containing protein n=1 Tax=Butyrivibrio proteoclasticus (strain ATCC 51982 / DSM 14932 / B316) TaxID=515622 RepID=E0RXC1_BUTPB|nr:TPM domain-containing protein [Butyrivibrio proteoclasticus]ADL32959.1 hypothetical protein bpr_I0210 [Butyrivibrio proteoclasticus B316]